ncbi:MAG: hypothetical protein AB8G14_10290 [Ilumatobacter sp.]
MDRGAVLVLIELAPVVGYGATAIYLSTSDSNESAPDQSTSASAGAHRIGTVRLLSDLDDLLSGAGIDVDDAALQLLDRLREAPDGLDDDSVELHELQAAYDVVRSLLRQAQAQQVEALGLVDVSPGARRTGLLRSWPKASNLFGLAQRGAAAVRQNDLQLDLYFSDGRTPIHDIASFSFGAEGGQITTATGESLSVDRDTTRALCDVADGATAWRVRVVPAAIVWAELLEGLELAADAVRASGQPAVIMVSNELAPVLYAVD